MQDEAVTGGPRVYMLSPAVDRHEVFISEFDSSGCYVETRCQVEAGSPVVLVIETIGPIPGIVGFSTSTGILVRFEGTVDETVVQNSGTNLRV